MWEPRPPVRAHNEQVHLRRARHLNDNLKRHAQHNGGVTPEARLRDSIAIGCPGFGALGLQHFTLAPFGETVARIPGGLRRTCIRDSSGWRGRLLGATLRGVESPLVWGRHRGQVADAVSEAGYCIQGLWSTRAVVHSPRVQNYVAHPSHYTNQHLQDVCSPGKEGARVPLGTRQRHPRDPRATAPRACDPPRSRQSDRSHGPSGHHGRVPGRSAGTGS
jgi:hypothetical protein